MTRKRRPQKQNNCKKQANSLRIIGGQWRSRKLQLQDAEGMRPTPDRIRETLFNWVQNSVHGSRCLDLFSGSGALGLEALSRGAKDVIFVEKNKAVANQLLSNLQLLESDVNVINTDAIEYLNQYKKNSAESFDLIFLDPPYRKGLIEEALKLLYLKELIDQNTCIYLEHESEEDFNWSQFDLEILKETSAGQVKCLLVKSTKTY